MLEFKTQSGRNPSAEKAAPSIKDYSRQVRRKLYFLFAMLVLVIILMKEARRPENWTWMGFKNSPVTNEAFELSKLATAGSPDQLFASASAAGELPTPPPQNEAETEDTTVILNGNSGATAFWKRVWETLETADRSALVELIQVSQKSPDQRDIHPADFDPLVSTLLRIDPRDDAYAKKWEAEIRPSLIAAYRKEDLTPKQRSAAIEIFASLDPLILGGLDDFTSPGQPADLPAWFRYWGRILDDNETESATSVSPVQLIAQPDVWRFKPVRLKGELLAGRKKTAGVHGPLRQNKVWYEWWIGNTHGADEVWCLYTSSKPDSLEVGEKFSDFKLLVESSGLFYKVRAYVDTQKQSNHCVLILADDLVVTQKTTNPVAEAVWVPSNTVMIASVIGVMIVAFLIAMLVYRMDKNTKVHQPGGEYKMQIESHLENLADDPGIKTLAEKLEELP